MRLVRLPLVALALAGCAGPAAADDESTPGDRTFVSVGVVGEQIPGGGPLTLEFADGRVSAFAGCNRATAPTDLSGGQLGIGELATTMMACPPPFADADTWMTHFLQARPAWTLTADTLTLSTATTTVTLRDKEAVDPDRPLVGTIWRVQSLVSGQSAMTSVALEQARPTLTINADQSVTGWTGCNTFYGRADVAAPTVTFATVQVAGPGCPGEPGDIERAIVGVLDGPVQVEIDADQLTLSGAKGDGLVLRAE
ncbi:heat-shock protein HslJ [Mycobacterium adipatum]|uniref:Heat-shock protein HslJ n=1 Tax=Mycobacterium adipatum TaxID=1682113 RepID=A0A172UQ18_9MYCO|nr:META domain-containing protein [Mycobacterium adipatum]ANE81096.1 heat-shock protein HslJ [Mycobacterium adipatum]MBI5736198.1 META domain-containing protein [Mycolicibacterium neoaurum]